MTKNGDFKSEDCIDSEGGEEVLVLGEDLGREGGSCDVHQVFTKLHCVVSGGVVCCRLLKNSQINK